MPSNSVSPEERLFKVIQGQKNAPSPGSAAENKKTKKDFRGMKNFFANLIPNPAIGPRAQMALSIPFGIRLHEIDPKALNVTLAFVLAVLTAMVVYQGVYKRPNISKIARAASAIGVRIAEEKKEPAPLKPEDFYTAEIQKRDIFSPVPELREEKPVIVEPVKKDKDKLIEASAGLTLKGISWGDFPKAMIKHEKENKVYFLKPGQMIGSTGIKLKEVLKNKVVIEYEEEEMELL